MPHDLHSRSASTAPLGAAPGPAHPSDRWCLPCEDGKLLVLRSTESAEQQEMNAYWRSQARGQVLDPPRPDANASLLMSSATSERSAPSPGSHGQSHAPDPALLDLAQRVDRMKLEACQGEIQGLKKKLVLLEEFNTDLAKLKTTAEAQAMQLDEQLMRSRMENKKLQDALNNQASQLREMREAKMAQEEQVQEAQEQMSAAAQQVVEATSKQAVLSQRVASLTQELAGLREERDTLKEDLALCGKENVDQTTSSTPQKLKEQHVSPNALLGRMQAELAMSEKMLRACEKENENLAQQNRQLRQGARLQREEVDGRQLQLVAELNAAKAEAAANPASMRRLAEVERELVATKERAEEHARELERCREAKRQLEREIIAGPPPKPPNQELEQMEARCVLAQSEVAEMQEKLRYYAQSQQAMEEDRRQVEKLSEELRAAKTENGDLRRRPGLKEASKKIAELRRQNEELNECLRKRNPDSILALIKACEPAPEEKRELRDLKGRIAELEAQLQERDAMYDRRIRGLRAQYDHMRHEYERRSESKRLGPDLVEESIRRVGPDHEAVLQARIKDLERQVEHTKSYYLTKLRKREPLVPPWKPGGKSTAHTQNPSETRQIQHLQQQLQEREQRIAELENCTRAQSSQSPQSPRQMAYPPPPTVPAVPGYPPPAPPAHPSPAVASSLIRLFMASPEGSAMVALCTAQHWLAQSMRLERYDEVAAHAEMLIPIFLAAESAAKGSGEPVEMDMSYGTHRVLLQHDALRLEMPLLPSRVWNAWRHAMQRVAVIASQASLGATHRPKVQLQEAMAELRQSAEAVIQQLLPDGHPGPAPGESMLPRLSLEAVREDLDQRCEDQVSSRLLEEAEAQAGLDHRLPWAELLAVLVRSGISKQCVDLCRLAARPDFSVSLTELRCLWRGEDAQPGQAYAGLFKALARIRLAVSRDPAVLAQLERAAVAGFLPRGDFMEALRSLPCALSLEERHQIASLFSPAGDVRRVCYPLFLHSVVPERFEEAVAMHSVKKADGRLEALETEWQSRLEEAKAESRRLHDQLHRQEVRSAEQAREIAILGAEGPSQAVRRLQGEVAMLESKVLEQQAIQSAAARKSEIALRAELDVKNHEVSTLKRALEARDSEVCRYEAELGAIIAELNVLREKPCS